jgi:hypothetical protein
VGRQPITLASVGTEPAWRQLLVEVAKAREDLASIEHETIRVVREAGATWEDIGEALGISRQAARERFSKPRPKRRL